MFGSTGLTRRPEGDGLERYQPEIGLKTIAMAETAESYYKRARNPDKLLEAVELKLTEQRKYILWWDSHGNPRGGPKNVADSATFVPEKTLLHRWRVRLKDEKTFRVTL